MFKEEFLTMKRIISLMLTLAVALSLLVVPAGAASTPEEALGEVNIYSGGYSMNYLAVNGRVQTQSYTYFLYENAAGETPDPLFYPIGHYQGRYRAATEIPLCLRLPRNRCGGLRTSPDGPRADRHFWSREISR